MPREHHRFYLLVRIAFVVALGAHLVFLALFLLTAIALPFLVPFYSRRLKWSLAGMGTTTTWLVGDRTEQEA